MSGGKAAGLSDEAEAKLSAVGQLMEEAKKNSEAFLSQLRDLMPLASRSVASEGETVPHGSEDESEAQRRPKRMRLTGPDLQRRVEELLGTDKLVGSASEKEQQLDRPSAAAEEVPPAASSSSSSTHPPPISRLPLPPFPRGGTPSDVVKWRMECKTICDASEKDYDFNLPTLRDPKDYGTTKAVQDWRHKRAVLAAARSIVSVTPISDDGPTRLQFTGFILRRYEHSGFVFSVIVTCSRVVCQAGRKLDPLPKLSVALPDKKTIIEANLLYFSDHFGIALLLLPMEFSLEIPRLGCCLDYNEEVFVLGKDKDASLGVRHGVISWTEESDFLGRDYYMFIEGEIPEGGNGGPVIDPDGEFRGMAFHHSPKPAVLSISTIMTCLEMFMHFVRIARPTLGLHLRTVASLDVELLECISDHNIRSGYVVDVVEDNSPALVYGIREGNVIVSLNGHHMLTLPKLEDYLLSLGWKNLINSVSTIDLKLVVCDLKGHTTRITVPVGFCDTPERALDS